MGCRAWSFRAFWGLLAESGGRLGVCRVSRIRDISPIVPYRALSPSISATTSIHPQSAPRAGEVKAVECCKTVKGLLRLYRGYQSRNHGGTCCELSLAVLGERCGCLCSKFEAQPVKPESIQLKA